MRFSGSTQPLHEPPSSRHSNVEPASLESNEKSAVAEFVSDAGDELIAVFGGAVSTVHAKVAGVGSVLSTASVARTSKV